MTVLIDAVLVNGPLGDPVVLLTFRNGRRTILFDLGDIGRVGDVALLRLSHVFVSHAHVDHFAGFDRLLRIRIGHPKPLAMVGPLDFIDRVEARLRGYTWNLLGPESPDFVVTVAECGEGGLVRQSVFRARRRFLREDQAIPSATRIVLQEPDFSVTAIVLDHGTPSLGFAWTEGPRITLRPEELDRCGLVSAPWINQAKRALRSGRDDETAIALGPNRTLTLAELRQGVFVVEAGTKVAYITDVADHQDNRNRMLALARDADVLFIETVFADEDRAQAEARRHLTAGAAGRIGRDARAKTLVPMHVSARYADRPNHVLDQAEAAFGRDLAR